jgi:hypothetical protein
MSDDFNFSTDGFVTSYDDFVSTISPTFSSGVSSMGMNLANDAAQGFAEGGVVGGIAAAFKDAIGFIGRGRREADEITAVQTPLSQMLETVNRQMGSPTITVPQLQQLRTTVTTWGEQFHQVLNRPWKDGRAADQAYATIFGNKNGTTDTEHPGYLTVTVQNIDKMLAARGVGGPTANAPADTSGLGTLAAIGAAIWAFLK